MAPWGLSGVLEGLRVSFGTIFFLGKTRLYCLGSARFKNVGKFETNLPVCSTYPEYLKLNFVRD